MNRPSRTSPLRVAAIGALAVVIIVEWSWFLLGLAHVTPH